MYLHPKTQGLKPASKFQTQQLLMFTIEYLKTRLVLTSLIDTQSIRLILSPFKTKILVFDKVWLFFKTYEPRSTQLGSNFNQTLIGSINLRILKNQLFQQSTFQNFDLNWIVQIWRRPIPESIRLDVDTYCLCLDESLSWILLSFWLLFKSTLSSFGF